MACSRPTFQQRQLIAVRAGVVVRTVDNAYKPKYRMRGTTRARVETAAIELGLEPPAACSVDQGEGQKP